MLCVMTISIYGPYLCLCTKCNLSDLTHHSSHKVQVGASAVQHQQAIDTFIEKTDSTASEPFAAQDVLVLRSK